MAGYKETPRQKMIGMMYLFYTALLALNISAEVLNAFVIVNNGMERTVKTFGEKNIYLYSDFEAQYAMNQAKVGPFYNAANEIKTETEALVEQIRLIKDRIVDYTEYKNVEAKSENYKPKPVEYILKDKSKKEVVETAERPGEVPLEWIKIKDNYDKPMEILLGVNTEKGDKGEATKLKKAFAAYKKNVKAILAKTGTDTTGLKLGLETPEAFNQHAGLTQNWEMNTFFHTVLAADLVLLNKYITEVRNIEFEVVKRLYNQIDASSFKFDEISAKVIPHANIVLTGAEYKADIFVAAYSTTDTPTVYLKSGVDSIKGVDVKNDPGINVLDSANEGVIQYTVKTGQTGEFTYAGVIQIKDPAGAITSYPFNSSYSVIKPSATISADKMNVVYRGLANPISISAAGFTLDKINLSSSGGGSLRKTSAGHYEFTPTSSGNSKTVYFSVTGTDATGKSVNLVSRQEYRVMPLPPPTITLAGMREGTISKQVIKSAPVLQAVLEDFLFDGVKYNVVSFILKVGNWKTNVTGNRLPSAAIQRINRAPSGTSIIINNLKTRGPDGLKGAVGPSFEIK